MLVAFAVLLIAIGVMTYDVWREVDEPPSLLTARHGAGAGMLGDVAFIVGGVASDGSVLGTVEALGASFSRWAAVAPLAVAVRSPAVTSAGDTLYVIGGFTGDDDASATDAMQVYDPSNDSWRLATPPPVAVGGAAAIGADDVVYLIGGRNAQGASAGTYAYSLRLDSWAEVTPLPTARSDLAVGLLAGHIHAVGGSATGPADAQAATAHEVLDLATGEWSALSPLPAGRVGAVATVAGGCLLLAGGSAPGGEPGGPVLAFSPAGAVWRPVAEPVSPRTGQTALGLPGGDLLLIGGQAAGGGSAEATVERLRPADCASDG